MDRTRIGDYAVTAQATCEIEITETFEKWRKTAYQTIDTRISELIDLIGEEVYVFIIRTMGLLG